MTEEEFRTIKRVNSDEFPVEIVPDMRTDKYGVYSTGIFAYKGKIVVINLEFGRWHLSVSANHTLGYYELKEIRYKFMPNDMIVAQIFPPREQFVNIHENCFHLYEVSPVE